MVLNLEKKSFKAKIYFSLNDSKFLEEKLITFADFFFCTGWKVFEKGGRGEELLQKKNLFFEVFKN